MNLINNAVKYSDEGQTVIVRAFPENAALVLEVVDEGAGIPANELERIFERFYRVDRARSRELGGTGLGLSIVKHIAQAHRGNVTVASALGAVAPSARAGPLTDRVAGLDVFLPPVRHNY